MPVPYTFADQSGAIPLAELDANFAAIPDYAYAAGNVSINAQPNITSVGTLNSLTVAGNTSIGGTVTVAFLNATSNVYGNYVLGNGTFLTGMYGNANVENYLANGSITIANIQSNVANNTNAITTLQGQVYTNANVAAYLPIYNGNIGNIIANGLLTTGVVSASGNIRGANFNTVGSITATGNVYGNYIIGDGSQLTNIPGGNIVGGYGNSNVAAYLPTYLPTNTSNVSANYFIGDGSQLTGLPASYSNANVASYLPVYSGNISANVISATGSVASQGIISATGNIVTAGYFVGNFAGNVTGNIVVPGSNTQVLFNTNGNVDAVGGLTYNKGSNTLTVLGIVTATGNVAGNYFIGNGSQLTGITTGTPANISNGTSNVSITTSNGNVTVGVGGTANIVTVATTGQYVVGLLSVTGNVIANNFVGGGAGTPTVSSATNLDLSAATAVRVTGGGVFRLPGLTTAEIANLIPVNGDMVYNSSLNKFQGYENGAWGNLI